MTPKSKGTANTSSSSSNGGTDNPLAKQIETSFEQGNFAAVRALAARIGESGTAADKDRAQRLFALTTVDPVQVLVGAGAIAVLGLVALFILGR